MKTSLNTDRSNSGARKKRPELERLRADDVVVTRLDRLARSTSERLRIAEAIEEKHAGLQSIAEPWADTTTLGGRMVLTVFAGIATRTEEGRRAAQTRGVPFRRPPKLRPDQRALARHLIEEGKSVSEAARTFNVHVATIYRYTTRRPYDCRPFLSHARSVMRSGASFKIWNARGAITVT